MVLHGFLKEEEKQRKNQQISKLIKMELKLVDKDSRSGTNGQKQARWRNLKIFLIRSEGFKNPPGGMNAASFPAPSSLSLRLDGRPLSGWMAFPASSDVRFRRFKAHSLRNSDTHTMAQVVSQNSTI